MTEVAMQFQAAFAAKLKERGLPLRKLAEMTGIPEKHLENLAAGDFARLPAAPYVRGYLQKLAPILDFNPDVFWEQLKQEQVVSASGATDAMPRNRFAKVSGRLRYGWIAAGIALIALYAVFRFAAIVGRPELAVHAPTESQLTVSTQEFLISGITKHTDRLTINGDQVEFKQDGSWQKVIQLQSGLNSFEIKAAKFLGGESVIMKQVFYEPSPASSTGQVEMIIIPEPFSSSTTPTATTSNSSSTNPR